VKLTLKRTGPAYLEPTPNDILQAYINKNAAYNRATARRIKRQLRKLAYF